MRTTAVLPICDYQADQPVSITVRADCITHRFMLSVNGGEEKKYLCMGAVDAISRFVLRTGAPRFSPTIEDIPSEDTADVLRLCDEKDKEAV